MANLIQIKRSLTTATPVALANGEQAFTSNGDVLYIGANGVVVPIGGKRTPGVLTANQALVANSTSYIDVVKTANLFIGTTSVNAINAIANVTHLGASANNELPTTWAVKTYVDSSIAYTITNNSSNTQLLFNDSGVVGGDAGITYNKNTDTLSVAGSLAVNSSIVANNSGLTVTGSVNATATVNAASHTVGTSLTANSLGLFTTGTVNAASLVVGTTFVANSTGVTTTGYANVAATLAAGNTTITGFANVVSDTATIRVGNSSVFFTGNTTGFYPVSNTAASALGSATQRWVLNATTGSFAGAVSGITTLAAGNTTITGFVNATAAVNAASHTVGSNFIANSTGVTTTGYANVATTLAAGNTTITGFVNATASVNSAVLAVGTNFVANTTRLTSNVPAVLNANVALGDSSVDVISFNGEVNTSIIPAANVIYNLGSLTDRWNYVYAANVHSTQGYFEGNVQIVGDLVVQGNVTTQNVSSLEIQDPLIYLAGNNYASDLVDIGFVGNYYDGVNNRHAGLVRHAADDQFYLFHRYLPEPDNNVIHVDWSNTDFTVATLNTFLKSGALTSNSSAVTITANSTLAVNITANSVTLATPLAATSGGTGFNTYTSGDLLVGNGGNALTKLGLGADGKILQSNGTALVYADLDGGIF